jgi:hypothetical protein
MNKQTNQLKLETQKKPKSATDDAPLGCVGPMKELTLEGKAVENGVGAPVGAPVGRRVGTRVGVYEGAFVGTSDAKSEGRNVGVRKPATAHLLRNALEQWSTLLVQR